MSDIGHRVREFVLKQESMASEAYVVTTVKGYRRRSDGVLREITIEILDRGSGESSRWSAVVTDEDGRGASGNPNDDLEAAIAMVHWGDLDHE